MSGFDTAAAIVVLHVKTSLSMLEAKRLIERLISQAEIVTDLPDVQDIDDLTQHLSRAGVDASVRVLQTAKGSKEVAIAASHMLEPH